MSPPPQKPAKAPTVPTPLKSLDQWARACKPTEYVFHKLRVVTNSTWNCTKSETTWVQKSGSKPITEGYWLHGHVLQRTSSLLNELPCHSITSVLTTYTHGSERTVVVHSRSVCSPTSGYLPSAICWVTSGIYLSQSRLSYVGYRVPVDAGLKTLD